MQLTCKRKCQEESARQFERWQSFDDCFVGFCCLRGHLSKCVDGGCLEAGCSGLGISASEDLLTDMPRGVVGHES